jgi:hypothetical protein
MLEENIILNWSYVKVALFGAVLAVAIVVYVDTTFVVPIGYDRFTMDYHGLSRFTYVT